LIIIFSLEFSVNHPEWTIPAGDPTSKSVMGSNSPDRHIHLLLLSPHGAKTSIAFVRMDVARRSAVPFSNSENAAIWRGGKYFASVGTYDLSPVFGFQERSALIKPGDHLNA
jgi:hypothetical protein